MYENSKLNSSSLDAIALYGYNSISCYLSRIFSSIGLQVYLLLTNSNELNLSLNNLILINI